MMTQYDPKQVEPKWQKIWTDTGIYKTATDSDKPNFYYLTMFPYPSGDLHTGHWYAMTAPDVMARWHRMNGSNVLFPMGWDAFGLPAENAAIKRNIPPAKWTKDNIASMKKQLLRMGAAFDWEKELSTADPSYYRWTQWLFLLLYKQGLAYRQKGLQNWCPSCQTVLANEQVVGDDNHCERCNTVVEKKELEQWYFKITDYAERLLDDLDDVDWPQKVVTMQKNWIGKSEGARIHFDVEGSQEKIEAFTTRPDTLFGATYMVLAPEHPLVDKITSKQQQTKVKKYQKKAASETNVERLSEREMTGVFTGSYAINPVNDEKIPIWISDYVLMSYGTGAIMAVPAHDQRDYGFAVKFDLPIRVVIEPVTGEEQKNPEFRRSIVAIVENDKGELLSINWGSDRGGNLFIGGGLEEQEDLVECAKREITEETGYYDVELVSQTETIHHRYFAISKRIPRQIEAVGLLFKLKSGKRSAQQLEEYEKDKFKVEWIAKAAAAANVHDPLHRYVFERLIEGKVYTGEGKVTSSGKYDGLDSNIMRQKIVKDLERKKHGQGTTQYKLRDWLISRQRYWGPPIPIVYCEKCGTVPVPEDELPVLLPEDVEFEPTGQSPLLKREDFVNTVCPECDAPARREVDTMDTFVDSSWYYLRYPNPGYTQGMFDPDEVKKWLPVDHYSGGIEHAILHLLYSRFITKVLQDYAGLGFSEPFKRLTTQGMILGPDGQKMSKSRGNVVSPDNIIDSGYGADAFRTYMLFIGPWTDGGPFATEGLAGTYRFLNRVWSLVQEYIDSETTEKPGAGSELELELLTGMHKTIRKVTNDIETLSFNTAIATLMELTNDMYKLKSKLPFGSSPEVWNEAIEGLLLLLAPFAPHITEELWAELTHHESIHIQGWPEYDEKYLRSALATVVVQVNGKVKDRITLEAGASDDETASQAQKSPRVNEEIAGKKVVRTIVVPDKLVNFVVSK